MQRRYLLLPLTLIVAASVACGDDRPESRMIGPGPMAGAGPMPGPAGGMNGGGAMMLTSEFVFLAQMIPHHEEAIASARILRDGTERMEMRRFAESIITTQSAEVDQMRRWLGVWYAGRDTSVTYQPMMRDLEGLQGDALDRAFLEDMIRHHMMAVMMSQQLLGRNLAQHVDVRPFAESIRDNQSAEIRTMQQWLNEWF